MRAGRPERTGEVAPAPGNGREIVPGARRGAAAAALILGACCSAPPPAEKYFDLLIPFNTLSGFAYAIDAGQWRFAYDCLTPESKKLYSYTRFKFAMRFNVDVPVDPENPKVTVPIRDLIIGSDRYRYRFESEDEDGPVSSWCDTRCPADRGSRKGSTWCASPGPRRWRRAAASRPGSSTSTGRSSASRGDGAGADPPRPRGGGRRGRGAPARACRAAPVPVTEVLEEIGSVRERTVRYPPVRPPGGGTGRGNMPRSRRSDRGRVGADAAAARSRAGYGGAGPGTESSRGGHPLAREPGRPGALAVAAGGSRLPAPAGPGSLEELAAQMARFNRCVEDLLQRERPPGRSEDRKETWVLVAALTVVVVFCLVAFYLNQAEVREMHSGLQSEIDQAGRAAVSSMERRLAGLRLEKLPEAQASLDRFIREKDRRDGERLGEVRDDLRRRSEEAATDLRREIAAVQQEMAALRKLLDEARQAGGGTVPAAAGTDPAAAADGRPRSERPGWPGPWPPARPRSLPVRLQGTGWPGRPMDRPTTRRRIRRRGRPVPPTLLRFPGRRAPRPCRPRGVTTHEPLTAREGSPHFYPPARPGVSPGRFIAGRPDPGPHHGGAETRRRRHGDDGCRRRRSPLPPSSVGTCRL